MTDFWEIKFISAISMTLSIVWSIKFGDGINFNNQEYLILSKSFHEKGFNKLYSNLMGNRVCLFFFYSVCFLKAKSTLTLSWKNKGGQIKKIMRHLLNKAPYDSRHQFKSTIGFIIRMLILIESAHEQSPLKICI